ncbi:hypothetical protein F5Y16DRAFT_357542 [Xylariaceae sp. FL0255]|nr:hypothetical protein F5Y16DRAFT_357542 [Xylariaceae sp. FL0255]
MDDFSDDDFDTLNANVLQELENKAIQSTQARNRYQFDLEDDDLDDAIVQDDLPGKHLPPQPAAQVVPRVAPQQHQHQHQQPQNGWGQAPVSATHLRLHQGVNNSQIPYRSQAATYSQIPRPPPPLSRPAPSIPSRYQPSQAQHLTGAASHELATLQAQIRDLTSKLSTKDGEISIVRKRLEKTKEDHEREVQAIKTRTAEQLAKKERAVEAAKAAQQSATTELEFTRRDLKDEIDRAKRQDGARTPKRNITTRAWGISDGFEDVEMARSPSKGQRGKNAGAVASSMVEPPLKLTRTPTRGKRKRPTIDSPVMALEVHSEDTVMNDASKPDDAVPNHQSRLAPRNILSDYTQVILSHSSAPGRPLTFQYLAGFALASKPNETLASLLLHKLSTAGNPDDPTQLPIEFCLEVIRLWDDCRKESCLAPIIELVSLVVFTLQLQTVPLAPHIAPPLLAVAMDSCYEVAIPRFNNTLMGDPTDDVFVNLRNHIDTSKILSLLHLTALGCATADPVGGSISSPVVDFWNGVHIHFILMFLSSRKQPLDDFVWILRLLCTSVFADSIGPINPDKAPELVAQLIIDRVSINLIETLRWDVDEERILNVRLTVLQTLSAFARSSFGLKQLVKHELVIPRLVTLLSNCIEELYDGEMQYSSLDEGQITDSIHLLVERAVLLLHLIVTTTVDGKSVDMPAKLAKTTGCAQRYLLSLARLNFADDLVTEETAELAHELLELAVTLKDGEELGEFFGG